MKTKEIDSLNDLSTAAKRKIREWKKVVSSSGGSGLVMRRFVAKLLWFFFWALLLSPIVRSLYSLAIVAGVLAIPYLGDAIASIVKEKISDVVYGRFVDSFSLRFLNKFIIAFILLTCAIGYVPVVVRKYEKR